MDLGLQNLELHPMPACPRLNLRTFAKTLFPSKATSISNGVRTQTHLWGDTISWTLCWVWDEGNVSGPGTSHQAYTCSPLRDANSRGSPRHRTRAMNTWHLQQQTPWCGRKILAVGKPAEVGRTQASVSPACIQGVGRAPPRTPTLLQTAWCRHLLDGGGSAWVGTFQKSSWP